ncbi:hypothetical protein D3C72_750070 [compost metagenome]
MLAQDVLPEAVDRHALAPLVAHEDREPGAGQEGAQGVVAADADRLDGHVGGRGLGQKPGRARQGDGLGRLRRLEGDGLDVVAAARVVGEGDRLAVGRDGGVEHAAQDVGELGQGARAEVVGVQVEDARAIGGEDQLLAVRRPRRVEVHGGVVPEAGHLAGLGVHQEQVAVAALPDGHGQLATVGAPAGVAELVVVVVEGPLVELLALGVEDRDAGAGAARGDGRDALAVRRDGRREGACAMGQPLGLLGGAIVDEQIPEARELLEGVLGVRLEVDLLGVGAQRRGRARALAHDEGRLALGRSGEQLGALVLERLGVVERAVLAPARVAVVAAARGDGLGGGHDPAAMGRGDLAASLVGGQIGLVALGELGAHAVPELGHRGTRGAVHGALEAQPGQLAVGLHDLGRGVDAAALDQVLDEARAPGVLVAAHGPIEQEAAPGLIHGRDGAFQEGHAPDHVEVAFGAAPAGRQRALGVDGQALGEEGRGVGEQIRQVQGDVDRQLREDRENQAAQRRVGLVGDPGGVLELQDVGVLVDEEQAHPLVVAADPHALVRVGRGLPQPDGPVRAVVGHRVELVVAVGDDHLGGAAGGDLHERHELGVGVLGDRRDLLGLRFEARPVVDAEVRRLEGRPGGVRLEQRSGVGHHTRGDPHRGREGHPGQQTLQRRHGLSC